MENASHRYQLLISTTTSKSQQTKIVFQISKKVNHESEYVIHLVECTLCNKKYVDKKYFGKAETAFNIRLKMQKIQMQY